MKNKNLSRKNEAYQNIYAKVNRDASFFYTVCQSLVSRGEKQDEESIGGRKRMDLIHTLCEMNPCEALFVRSICVSTAFSL